MRINIYKAVSTLLLILLAVGCVDVEEPVLPRYDVKVNLPGTIREYSVYDALDQDSTYVIEENLDSPDYALITYVDREYQTPIPIADNLKTDDFSISSSEEVGPVNINDVDPPTSVKITIDMWTNYQPGDQRVFNENISQLDVNLTEIGQFESITVQSGNMDLVFINRLPVVVELRGFKILNAFDNSEVLNVQESITIPAVELGQSEQSVTGSYPVDGKIIRNQLKYQGIIYSPGSNNQVVTIPFEAGTEAQGSFSNLVLSSATAIVPAQDPISINSTEKIGDSTFVKTATFDDGIFNLTIDNDISLNLALNITFRNLFNSTGQKLTVSGNIPANAQNYELFQGGLDLTGYKIESLTPGVSSNLIGFDAIVNVLGSSNSVTINSTDIVEVKTDFRNISFEYFEGKVKPTKFINKVTNFQFDVNDFGRNLTFDDINFQNPKVKILVSTSSNMNLEYDSYLEGSVTGNPGSFSSMDISPVLIPASGFVELDLTKDGLNQFLNSFTGGIPQKFRISGTTVVNKMFEEGSISKYDSLYGPIDLEVPLKIGISGGVLRDTFDVDLGDISEDAIDKIISGTLYFDIENSIPFNLKITGQLVNEFGQVILSLPPADVQPQNEKSIIVQSGQVDANGYVISSTNYIQNIDIIGDDIKKFFNKPTMTVRIEMETPEGSTKPAVFRTIDKLKFNVYGTFNYRVEED